VSTNKEATSREGSNPISSAVAERDPCIQGIFDLPGLLSGGELIVAPPGNAVVMDVSGVEELWN
jgi:hypothetical protein